MGAEGSLPLLQDAELGAWVGDRLVTLADLEDTTEGTRRLPGGDALVLRGRAAGVWLEAEFAWEVGTTQAPRGAVTLRIYPDQELATIRGVRFCAVPESAVLPGADPLLALVNGCDSGSESRIVTVAAGMAAIDSFAACGLGRGSNSLALAFDAAEPGEGRVGLEDGRVEIVSEWLPARPVFPQGDAGTLRIAAEPGADALAALRTLLAPSSVVDLERLQETVIPAGWSSRLVGASEDAIVANLEQAARQFDRAQLRLIHLDNGYQRAAGDWDTNAQFPHGHRWLTDRIHALGVQAGVWVAPFVAAERSGIPAAHPEWLLRQGGAPLVLGTRDAWGGRLYGLDGAHPAVQEWLFALGRRLVRDWGYDVVHADVLAWGTAGDTHTGGLTRAEAYRRGMAALRDGLGADTLLFAAGAPLQHSAGLVNGMRIGPDVSRSWGGVQSAARAVALRSFYHRTTWLNDPDCLVVGEPLTVSEARVWATVVALSGGVTTFAADLTILAAERLALLQRVVPPAPGGRPVGAVHAEQDVAPAVVTSQGVNPIAGTWRFRTGDDPAYASAGFDDSVWETIVVPGPWEGSGRSEYDGFAWYRVRFALPPLPGATDGVAAWLELGKVDDVDETFVNGTKVGQTGAFPPAVRGDRSAYRRYAIPAGTLNWGGENVLAVRVYDGGGAGGLWTLHRDRPADTWIVEGSDQWWTVALINWDDERRTMSLPLASAGIAAQKLHAYDVWAGQPLADVAGTLTLDVEPHDARVVGLRPVANRPVILGTSRHVVQGVDIEAEEWDATKRMLTVRSRRLDARPYTVTVTVPRGFVTTAARRLPTGHVVLEWPASDTVRELDWTLKFSRRP
jgi:hypothetical protein